MTPPMPPQPNRPGRIAEYIESRALRPQPVDLDDVRTMWQKAMNSASDARQPTLTPDGVVTSAYTAQLQGMFAILFAHGYRTGQDAKHHYIAIDAVRALAQADQRDDLAPLLNRLDGLRQQRAHSIYELEIATSDEAASARDLMSDVLPAAADYLRAIQPSVFDAPTSTQEAPATGPQGPRKRRGR